MPQLQFQQDPSIGYLNIVKNQDAVPSRKPSWSATKEN